MSWHAALGWAAVAEFQVMATVPPTGLPLGAHLHGLRMCTRRSHPHRRILEGSRVTDAGGDLRPRRDVTRQPKNQHPDVGIPAAHLTRAVAICRVNLRSIAGAAFSGSGLKLGRE